MTGTHRAASLLLLVLAAAVSCTEEPPDPRIAQVEQALLPGILIGERPAWTLEERMERHGVPGLGIAVIENSEVAWSKAYGLLDADMGDPVTEDPLFQAASISKPVTAVIALRLVQDGLLDLDTDVNEYLRSWKVPENEFTQDEKVTLRRLLSHHAGLTVHGFPGYAPGGPIPSIIQVLDGEPPSNTPAIRVDMVPGSEFRYSGGGYTVLQLLIEDVTGRPLTDLADEMVFEPLGMKSSSFRKPLPEPLAHRVSAGHTGDGASMPGHWFLDGGSSCCGLWTTPGDLARFAVSMQRALRGEPGSVLDEELAREMLVPEDLDGVGLGFFLEERGDAVYFNHSGGNPGFSCLLVANRDADYGAVVMTNGDNGGSLYQEIVRGIARVYGWEGYAPEEFASLDAMLEEYRRIHAERPDDPRVDEARLNRIGYGMLTEQRPLDAVGIMQLNAQLYPRSANCYDSLADAYEAAGDFPSAIAASRAAIRTLDEHPEGNERWEHVREIAMKRIWLLEEEPGASKEGRE
jgi:CubicO group peptidase (beta-lactamase class C family)